MDVDTLYLDNLDEYINDENRIITYKWLSLSLRVHVNQAKQMLYAFVQQQRNVKDNDGITVTYLVAGHTDDGTGNKVHQICIVPEENLEATKSRMAPVTSCHMYSVQKVKLKDTNSLYTADYDCLRENILCSNKYSAITCLAAKLRTDAEHANLRHAPSEAYQPPAQIKSSPKKGTGKTGKTQGGISSMFANASKKKEPSPQAEDKKEAGVEKASSKQDKKPAKKPPAGVMSFFANQASKANGKVKETQTKKTETDTKGNGSSEEDIKAKDVEVKEKEPQVQENPKSNRSRGKSKKKADSDEEEKSRNTKRRRIKAIVDSSSEEEIDIEDAPPTPPREPSPAPAPEPAQDVLVADTDEEEMEEPKVSPQDKKLKSASKSSGSGEKRRKRQKKRVPRTYIDEDGFMVTEKVWMSESCTDDSECGEPAESASAATEPPAKVTPQPRADQKKDKKKTPPKKVSPGTKQPGKQTSLMSFFKKK